MAPLDTTPVITMAPLSLVLCTRPLVIIPTEGTFPLIDTKVTARSKRSFEGVANVTETSPIPYNLSKAVVTRVANVEVGARSMGDTV